MKNAILFAAFAVVALTSATVLKPSAFKVDTTQSTIKWTAKKVTGQHWGYVKFADGSLSIDKGAVKGGFGFVGAKLARSTTELFKLCLSFLCCLHSG